MADTGMTLNVSPELVQPVIQAKIEAAIVAELTKSDPALVQKLVEHILGQCVDSEGKHARWGSNTKYVEWLCNTAVQSAAKAAIAQWLKNNEPLIVKHIEKAFAKQTGAMSVKFVEGLMKSITSTWNTKVDVTFVTPTEP